MNTIYLVGQISPKFQETYQWRNDIISKLKDEPFEIINPCSNPFNREILKKKTYAVDKHHREFGIDVIVPKDLTFVLRSNIAIANMNQYDPEKELLGSYFEMAWLYLHPEKTVIAFADDLNKYNCQHPFVQQSVHTWCNDINEVCYILKKYFI